MGKFKSTSKAVLAERRIERKMKKIAKKRAKDDTIDPMTGCVGPARRRRCRPVRPVVASRSFSRASFHFIRELVSSRNRPRRAPASTTRRQTDGLTSIIAPHPAQTQTHEARAREEARGVHPALGARG